MDFIFSEVDIKNQENSELERDFDGILLWMKIPYFIW
jgi:hypothetical protein